MRDRSQIRQWQEIRQHYPQQWLLIEAIEARDDQALPSVPYVKGYLRAYARYLGMAPEAILEAYGMGRTDQSHNNIRRVVTIRDTPAHSTSREKTPRFVTWGVGTLLAVSFGLWWYELADNSAAVALPEVPVVEPGAVALALPEPAFVSQPPAAEGAVELQLAAGAETGPAIDSDTQTSAVVVPPPPEKASISKGDNHPQRLCAL